MAYLDNEQSVHGSQIAELYRYAGTYVTYRYTSGPVPIVYQAPDEDEEFTYIPIATKRSIVNNVTHNDDGAEITIELPVDNEMVTVYGFQISPPELFCTVYRSNGPNDFIRYWHGHVENINVIKGTATVRVPSELAAALQADFPNVYFQGPCNHTLYDARCGIQFDDWSYETEITAIDGKSITVVGVGTLDGKLVGGDALLPSGERRMINAQAGTGLTINYPFAGAEVGDTLIVAAGCDLAWAGDCATRFDNQPRFGGMPFLPNDNVFNNGLEPAKKYGGEPCLPDCSPPVSEDATHMSFQLRFLGTPDNQTGIPGLGYWIHPDLFDASGSNPVHGQVEDEVCGEYVQTGYSASKLIGGNTVMNTEQRIWVRMQVGFGTVDCPSTGDRTEPLSLWCKKDTWPEWRQCPTNTGYEGGTGGTSEDLGGGILKLEPSWAGIFPNNLYWRMLPTFDDDGWVS